MCKICGEDYCDLVRLHTLDEEFVDEFIYHINERDNNSINRMLRKIDYCSSTHQESYQNSRKYLIETSRLLHALADHIERGLE
jgi:hypothetical protein